MPEREFEIYLSVLSRLLRLSPQQKDAIADELRDHLEERLQELMAKGLSREDAIQQALEDFGDVSGLAVEFTKVSRASLRRIVLRAVMGTTAVTALAIGALMLFSPATLPGPRLVPVVQADQTDAAEPTKKAADTKSSIFLADKELFPEFLQEHSGVKFVETSLEDACEFLAAQHHKTIYIEAEKFAEAGIAPDSPVTLLLEGVPLHEVLNHLLHPLKLTWRVDGDVIIVSTMEEDSLQLYRKEYDTSSLIKLGYRSESLREAVMNCTLSGWEADGSGIGTLLSFDDTLVIRQSYQAQRQIAELLAALETPQPAQVVGASSRRDAIRASLKSHVDCNFSHTPLVPALEFLTASSKVPFIVDHGSLTSAGVAVDQPLTLKMRDKPLEQVLRIGLRALNLTTINRDGVLIVTTQEAAAERLLTAVFDVRDLVTRPGAKELDDEKFELLCAVIQETTAGGWEADGSGTGTIIRLEPGVLVITQTDAIQDEIETLIGKLRTQAKKRPAKDEKPAAAKLVTKSYLMARDSATDLMESLPKLVAEESWKLRINGEFPSIHLVAAGHRYVPVEGNVVGLMPSSPSADKPAAAKPDVSQQPAPTPKSINPQAKKSEPEPTKNILVVPQATLVIRQTPENHRLIVTLIRNLTGDQLIEEVDPAKPAPFRHGGSSGSGFY